MSSISLDFSHEIENLLSQIRRNEELISLNQSHIERGRAAKVNIQRESAGESEELCTTDLIGDHSVHPRDDTAVEKVFAEGGVQKEVQVVSSAQNFQELYGYRHNVTMNRKQIVSLSMISNFIRL